MEFTVEQFVMYLATAGAAFPLIEDLIEQAPIDEDRKLILWLLAWSELPRVLRRAMLT